MKMCRVYVMGEENFTERANQMKNILQSFIRAILWLSSTLSQVKRGRIIARST